MFRLSQRSLDNLAGVHPDLMRVVMSAIGRTEVDFGVLDGGGLRTAEEQAKMFRRGASKLDGVRKISRHQTGHAVDLTPFVGNRPSWEWPLCEAVATAMRSAAEAEGVPVRWGGTWAIINGTGPAPVKRGRRGWDGPHFELPAAEYP